MRKLPVAPRRVQLAEPLGTDPGLPIEEPAVGTADDVVAPAAALAGHRLEQRLEPLLAAEIARDDLLDLRDAGARGVLRSRDQRRAAQHPRPACRVVRPRSRQQPTAAARRPGIRQRHRGAPQSRPGALRASHERRHGRQSSRSAKSSHRIATAFGPTCRITRRVRRRTARWASRIARTSGRGMRRRRLRCQPGRRSATLPVGGHREHQVLLAARPPHAPGGAEPGDDHDGVHLPQARPERRAAGRGGGGHAAGDAEHRAQAPAAGGLQAQLGLRGHAVLLLRRAPLEQELHGAVLERVGRVLARPAHAARRVALEPQRLQLRLDAPAQRRPATVRTATARARAFSAVSVSASAASAS